MTFYGLIFTACNRAFQVELSTNHHINLDYSFSRMTTGQNGHESEAKSGEIDHVSVLMRLQAAQGGARPDVEALLDQARAQVDAAVLNPASERYLKEKKWKQVIETELRGLKPNSSGQPLKDEQLQPLFKAILLTALGCREGSVMPIDSQLLDLVRKHPLCGFITARGIASTTWVQVSNLLPNSADHVTVQLWCMRALSKPDRLPRDTAAQFAQARGFDELCATVFSMVRYFLSALC